MSNDLPKTPQPEEVDLGQLFKLIGNAFSRFFNFIGSIFKSVFLAFVWLVFFIKTHVLKFAIAGVLGFVLGVLLEKTSDPTYKSSITIKQNYKTGENIYNSISYYNDLVNQKDTKTLSYTLGINEAEAEKILGFTVKPVVSENQKIQSYDAYIKTLDSVVASTVSYEIYLKNSEEYTYDYQQISIQAKERKNFKQVFERIIESVNTNDYFKREQEKDLIELQNEEASMVEALKQSDSLQSTYKRVLEKVMDNNNGGQTSITIEGASQIDKTKELDLYKSDLELREKLVLNRRNQLDKKYIIETISSKQDSGIIDNTKKFLGKSLNNKIYYAILFVGFTFLALLSIRFIKFIERFKN